VLRCVQGANIWHDETFLSAFAKLRKATINVVMSARLSVCTPACPPSTWNKSDPTGPIFMKYDIWVFFQKSVERIQLSLKSDKNNGYFSWISMDICDHISLSSSWNDKNFSDKSCRKNQNTHFTFNNIFFLRKSWRLWHDVQKSCTAGQATNGNKAQARWMLATSDYKHTLRICNNYCFSNATMVARTRLSVTLRVHCRHCSFFTKATNFALTL